MTKCNCPIDKIAECFSLPNCRLNKQPEAQRLADSIEDIQGLNTIDGTLVDHAARELRRLHEVNEELLKTMRQLACLGMGDRYGNSDGNIIAQVALNKATGETK